MSRSPLVDKPHRFATLDGLRGVAALVVVLIHCSGIYTRVPLTKHGHLAVDLFFILSGFVIAHAYQNRLDNGMPTWRFMTARLIRLWPLYLLGTLLGFAVLWPTYAHHHGQMLKRLLPGLFFVPFFAPAVQFFSMPFNFPTWSLFDELVTNVVHAAVLRRRTLLTLVLWAVAAGAVLVYAVWAYGTVDLGPLRLHAVWGIPRALFGYMLGLVGHRLWMRRPPQMRVPTVVPFALLTAVLMSPEVPGHDGAFQFLCVLVFFPVILFLALCNEPGQKTAKLCDVLGANSYAVYVLHGPFYFVLETLWLHFRQRRPEADAPWSGLIYSVVVVALSLSAHAFYDVPVRAAIRRRWKV